jgi:peptidoglycan-associated lipoprotein
MNNLLKALLLTLVTVGLLAGCATTPEPEQAPEPAAAPEPVAEQETESETELVDTFYFDFDQSTLTPRARAPLSAWAERLQDSNAQVRVEGHTDERGSREYNMGLGERRAKAVRDYLVLQGLSSNRIEVVSYGEERPIAMGSNEQAWSQNRRAMIRDE